MTSRSAPASARGRARRCLVTGGSRGIGRATALRLAQDGHDVALTWMSREREAQEVARDVRASGVRCLTTRCDVSDPAQVDAAFRAVEAAWGPAEVLVANAGIYERRPWKELDFAAWRRTMTVNLDGTFHCVRRALPAMVAAGWGRIVGLSSILGSAGSAHGMHYAASKAGIVGLLKSVAREVAGSGVTANCVAPGAIDTAIIADDTPEERARRDRAIPVGRVGRPEEIAEIVAYLASEAAAFTTGATIHANGGAYLT